MTRNQLLQDFVDYTKQLKGDEKGEAQLFCDRFFRAFGHDGIIEANGALEARIKFNSTGHTKFADCLWSPPNVDGVLIEMKKKAVKNLEYHFPQARDYWIEMNPEVAIGPGAQKPKYIILCNFDRFLIYRQLSLVDEISIDDFVDRASAFNFMLPENKEPLFHNNVEAISHDAAQIIGEIFKHLIFDKNEDREIAQKFLLQCVVALFSEDFGLLPPFFFTELIRDCQKGQSSYDLLGALFSQMANDKPAKGGRFKDIKYFNGGLFQVVEPLELDSESLDLLAQASDFNWKNVSPPVFGALFESTMNEQERHQYGAHFTSEADIQKVINPTIIRPWKDRLNKSKTLSDLSSLLEELGNYRVLDPACGCGNFLYIAYRSLKDIEMQIIEKIVANFSASSSKNIKFGISRVSTRQFHGIDILPIAIEVAKVTMTFGKELAADEWNKRISPMLGTLGFSYDTGLPLDSLEDNIVCDDALFCSWPHSDVIIGNPPYQSKNKISQELGVDYVNRVRARYPDVPGRADYCVYWYRRAHDEMNDGQYAGLVGTNTIRQNYSREGGLDYIVNNKGTIIEAVSTQVWSGDAAVHVSIVNWRKGGEKGSKRLAIQRGDSVDSPFEYHDLEEINSALSLAVDLSTAKSLFANKNPKLCFQGQTHGHKGFLVKRDDAELLIANDHKCTEVLFPFLTADEMIGARDSLPKRYVIDMRKNNIFHAKEVSVLFDQIHQAVFSDRQEKAKIEEERNHEVISINPNARINRHHSNFFRHWWKLSYSRDEAMDLIETLPRYCVCGRVTKRPIFEFISPKIHPNDALQVFSLDDDYSFGILQSTVHWEWFTARCSTLKGDFRYTSKTVFESFPWPQTPTKKQVKIIADCAMQLRSVRRKIMAEHNYSFRDLYRIMEESPANPVSEMQDKLDAAVFAAYGLKKKDDILAFLLELNLKLSQKETDRLEVVGPGLPPIITDKSLFVSGDSVQMP